ncbi:hypothetical protein ABT084_13720 [Streptomyces sp. NPDC002138]|uniref:DUF7848 domain-containing protein n=1 Tax=Streptomyces sp. NPDC002138 TaxID=3154410 RepID=UPI00331BFC5A
MSAQCLHEGCGWEADKGDDVAGVDRQCMRHASLNAYHSMFRRSFEDVAIVQQVRQ